MPRPGPNEIRIVVIEDAASARYLLVALLQSAPEMNVVGVAANGEDGVRLVARLRPDVVIMDLALPESSGLAATREIMDQVPTPIVIVSSGLTRSDVDLTFQALQAGALTVVRKPGLNDPHTSEQVLQVIRQVSRVPVARKWADKSHQASKSIPALLEQHGILGRKRIQVIGIASSTGGPPALADVLGPLPADYPVPILGIHHMARGFSGGLADWLDEQTALKVDMAGHGEAPRPGTFLLAPSDYHMQVNAWGLIELSKTPPCGGMRPSADVLFRSLANNYGPRAAGIVLSGMGDDGADGLQALRQAQGLTIAQSEQSCVVDGMPQEAVLRNAASLVLSPPEIAALLGVLLPTEVVADV